VTEPFRVTEPSGLEPPVIAGHRRRERRRAPWVLGGIALLVVAFIVGGTLFQRSEPAAGRSPSAAASEWSTTTPPASIPTTAAVTPTPTPTPTPTAPKPAHFVFPVVGNYSYERTHHDYPATDVIAPCGSTIRAVTDGVILEVTRVDTWNAKTDLGPVRGGLSVSLLGDDGVRYYGSHFEKINANINPGVRVSAGETLGLMGETGDASVCHLHFGISPSCAKTGDWWIRRGEIWPWSYLDSWRQGGNLSPVPAINDFLKQHGCPSVAGIPEP
jgi:murein DD-endopeptidase MepM/ murein hydrolase activator NlpD